MESTVGSAETGLGVHATSVPAVKDTAHSSDTDRFMSQYPSSESAISTDQH